MTHVGVVDDRLGRNNSNHHLSTPTDVVPYVVTEAARFLAVALTYCFKLGFLLECIRVPPSSQSYGSTDLVSPQAVNPELTRVALSRKVTNGVPVNNARLGRKGLKPASLASKPH